jgi:TM2 domain-containing membrane protein YozV
MVKDRTVAIVLAFFLGSFGGHKFYLGNNLAGVLYLLFSWTLIPLLIAFFDFLGLLLMSEQAFQAQYNLGMLQSGHILRAAKDVTGAATSKNFMISAQLPPKNMKKNAKNCCGICNYEVRRKREEVRRKREERIGVNLTSNVVTDCCLSIKSRSPLAPLIVGGDRKLL